MSSRWWWPLYSSVTDMRGELEPFVVHDRGGISMTSMICNYKTSSLFWADCVCVKLVESSKKELELMEFGVGLELGGELFLPSRCLGFTAFVEGRLSVQGLKSN